MRRSACALGLIVFTASALGQAGGPPAHSSATLRVGLWTLWHDKAVTVAPAHGSAASLRMCEGCAPETLKEPTQIRAVDIGLVLPGGRKAAVIWISGTAALAAHGESITLENPLRVSARNGVLVLAVTLPVESYVERVVASESGAADSGESLKALAIVVRSFALHVKHGHAEYDLCDSTHCQLLHWGGTVDRRAAAHAATLATAGETLEFHGQRAAAWFHQNCGGRTATPDEAWPAAGPHGQALRQPMPWLVSRADPYCTAKGARGWSTSVSFSDLTAALATAGLVQPGWTTLAVARRGESGRAVTLQVGPDQISAEDFRLAVGRAMGWGKILSTWFEISRQRDEFVFHGRGSGHGVGLCQAGATAMAALGRDSGQILQQYFPGATVADEDTGLPWQTLPAHGFALQTLVPGDAAFLPQLSQALAEAESRSGLQPAGGITVRAFRSTPAFRDATLAPGWVAAFTEGNWIATQPLSTLAARRLLGPVLRHEFLHALIEGQAAPGTPLWLREGLVEAWSDGKQGNAAPAMKVDEVDRALAHASSEAEAQVAHRAAGWYAERLLEKYGRAQVVAWLRGGLPASVMDAIR